MVEEAQVGKPKRDLLGYEVPISLVRLILLSLEDILEENAPPVFQMLGRTVGRALGVTRIEEIPDVFKQHKLGLVEIAQTSEDKLTVRFMECFGCSGMRDYNESISQLERGVLAGALESATGGTASINESKCCTKGGDFCEFEVVLMS